MFDNNKTHKKIIVCVFTVGQVYRDSGDKQGV